MRASMLQYHKVIKEANRKKTHLIPMAFCVELTLVTAKSAVIMMQSTLVTQTSFKCLQQ